MQQHKSRMPWVRQSRWILVLASVFLLSACASLNQPHRDPTSTASIPIDNDQAIAITRYAQSLQGLPYRYGGSEPRTGFDCSGLVCHVYGHYGYALPRSSRDMGNQLLEIPQEMLMPGDLVFFNTTGQPFSHVGIYIGEDKFVHAPSSRTGRVMTSSLKQAYWAKRFQGARRPLTQSQVAARNALLEP